MRRVFRFIGVLVLGFAAVVVAGGRAGADVNALAGAVIHVEHDNRCLDVYAGGAGPWVQAWNCNGQANQRFHYVLYPEGTAEIRTSDYWCVDGRWGQGASLERAQCDGSPGQRWRVQTVPERPGYAIWSVQYPNLLWDVHGRGSGTKVQLWTYNGFLNQFWYFESA